MNKLILLSMVLISIVIVSGCVKGQIGGEDIVYSRSCVNSPEEAESQIESNFVLTSTTEEENYFLLKAYYQAKNIKYPYTYYIPKCSYIEIISNEPYFWNETNESLCEASTLAVIRKNIDKKSALEGVLFYWSMLHSQTYGFEIKDSDIRELDNKFIVPLTHTSFVGGDWGLCDYTSTWEVEYCIDKESGEISLNKRTLLERVKGKCHKVD